ncbi:hypothetical protein CYMTET_32382, partial [Cymbomonas tetramitiformis]
MHVRRQSRLAYQVASASGLFVLANQTRHAECDSNADTPPKTSKPAVRTTSWGQALPQNVPRDLKGMAWSGSFVAAVDNRGQVYLWPSARRGTAGADPNSGDKVEPVQATLVKTRRAAEQLEAAGSGNCFLALGDTGEVERIDVACISSARPKTESRRQ